MLSRFLRNRRAVGIAIPICTRQKCVAARLLHEAYKFLYELCLVLRGRNKPCDAIVIVRYSAYYQTGSNLPRLRNSISNTGLLVLYSKCWLVACYSLENEGKTCFHHFVDVENKRSLTEIHSDMLARLLHANSRI